MEEKQIIKSRRKSAATQEKIRQFLDYDESDDIIEIPKPPKKEKVAGRGRGRPPTKRENDIYVFTTSLANSFTELVLEGYSYKSIIDCHRKFIISCPFLTQEVIRNTLNGIIKFRNWSSTHKMVKNQPPNNSNQNLSLQNQSVNVPRQQNVIHKIPPNTQVVNYTSWQNDYNQPTHMNQMYTGFQQNTAPSIVSQSGYAAYPFCYTTDSHQQPVSMPYRPESLLNLNPPRYAQPQQSQSPSQSLPPLAAINGGEHSYGTKGQEEQIQGMPQ